MQAARRQAIGRRGGWPGRLAPSQADRAGGFIAGLGCRWGGTNQRPEKARCRAGEAGPVGVVGRRPGASRADRVGAEIGGGTVQAGREPGRSVTDAAGENSQSRKHPGELLSSG
jgi:hypothetical protein